MTRIILRCAVSWIFRRYHALRKQPSVDKHAGSSHFDAITRQSNYALNIIRFERRVIGTEVIIRVIWISRILKDDDVAAPDFPLR